MRAMNYYIDRSGKLEQQYVLWLSVNIECDGFSVTAERGMGNLGISECTAVASAEKRVNLTLNKPEMRSGTTKTLIMCESASRELVPLRAFGSTFKATKKGYCADANPEFWEAWKNNKTKVKSMGFRCFKSDDGFKMFIPKEMVENK